MKHKPETKNDFFHAFVMFTMFAAVVFGVAGEFVHRFPEAMLVDFNETVEPRAMSAEVDARAVATTRMAVVIETAMNRRTCRTEFAG